MSCTKPLAAGIFAALICNLVGAALPSRTVALSGEHAPGTPAGANFNTGINIGFRDPALDPLGRVSFQATVTGGGLPANSSGVWSERNGTLGLVALQGQPAAGCRRA